MQLLIPVALESEEELGREKLLDSPLHISARSAPSGSAPTGRAPGDSLSRKQPLSCAPVPVPPVPQDKIKRGARGGSGDQDSSFQNGCEV